jgi:hypothetical protein
MRIIALFAGSFLMSALQAADAPPAPTPVATLGRLDFPLHTSVVKNEDVTVHVAWPVDASGAALPAARDIVYYQPWWNEKNFATDHGVFEEMAKAFTVVGIFLNDQENPKGVRETLDPESGSYAAIEEAIETARTKLHLPPGKPFATGHSSGACLIYWAAGAHPETFEAIAPIAGLPPTNVTLPPPAIPTLHVHTFGDWTTKESMKWHQQALANSVMLTPDPKWEWRTNQIWLHLNSSESIQLTVAWLRGVADLRAAHAGKLPPMRAWPVQVPAAQVAGTAEEHPTGTRAFPNQDLATRFTQVHRRIERATDAASGMVSATVTPLAGADRTVIVLVDPARKFDMAMYDAVLVAGKGAVAIAVQGGTEASLAALVAAHSTPGADGHSASVAVIAPAALSGRLAALPATTTRLVLDPTAPVAPGVLAVAAQSKPDTAPDLRHVHLLQAACVMLASK